MSSPRIAIIGAGYAGLACAVELARRHIPVTVFERSYRLGGRARSVHKDGYEFDNGQHILIGAYSELMRLLRVTGCSPRQLMRIPLTLNIPSQLYLRAAPLPAPFHLMVAVLSAQGLNWTERFALLRLMRWLKSTGFKVPQAMTVDALLEHTRQPERLSGLIWRPLCIAALNTPATKACAQVFANVLRDSLAADAAASEYLLPRVSLSELFPVPAVRFLGMRRSRVYTGNAIHSIQVATEGLYLEGDHDGQCWDQVVVATAAYHAGALLASTKHCASVVNKIDALSYEAIVSLYLKYDAEIRLPAPMIALDGEPAQWAFDRGQITGQENDQGMIACVTSAWHKNELSEQQDWANATHLQLERVLQRTLPAPKWTQLVTEKRATFACYAGLVRPEMRTGVPGLWLAGDYIQSDYPATIESAVRSGVACAEAICNAMKRN